jgi:hypothetical protein
LMLLIQLFRHCLVSFVYVQHRRRTSLDSKPKFPSFVGRKLELASRRFVRKLWVRCGYLPFSLSRLTSCVQKNLSKLFCIVASAPSFWIQSSSDDIFRQFILWIESLGLIFCVADLIVLSF